MSNQWFARQREQYGDENCTTITFWNLGWWSGPPHNCHDDTMRAVGECEAVLREAPIQASAQTMSSISRRHQTVQRQPGKDNWINRSKPRDRKKGEQMRDTIRSIYQGVTIVLLAMGLSTPGCGSVKNQNIPINITERRSHKASRRSQRRCPGWTHTVDGDLLIGNSPGRDPSTPKLLTGCLSCTCLTKDGAGLSLLPSEAYPATLPPQSGRIR